MPICVECVLNVAEMKNINQLQFLVDEAKNKVGFCQNQYTTLDNYLADLQDQLEATRGNIEETYQSYKAILEKRRVINSFVVLNRVFKNNYK